VPSSAELQNLVSLYNQGRIKDALRAGSDLLAREPDDPSLNNMVGVLHARLGHFDKALAHYDRALSLRDGYAEAFNNRGNVLLRLQRFEDALQSYQQAVAAMPGYADAHNGLGNASFALGRYAEAAQSFGSALKINPGMAQAGAGYGKSLRKLGYYEPALEYLRQAITMRPDDAAWHNEHGNILCDLGRAAEAIKCYERALALDPELVEVHGNIGNAHIDAGDTDAAIANYEEALRLKPDYAEIHYNLAFARKFSEDDEHLHQLQALADQPDLSDNDRCYIDFALGKAYEDIQDYDRSFARYEQGNRLRKAMLGYDIAADREQFAQIRRVYGERFAPLLQDAEQAESATTVPIFIVGMPRSGTSLVEQILASHSAVFGAGELDTASRILSPFVRGSVTDALPDVDAAGLAAIRAEYLDDMDFLAPGARFVTDKMPGNFRWIGLLLAALPEAKVVHVQRNPAATCWSMYKRLFNANGFTNDLADLGEYYRLYEELMAFWGDAVPGRVYNLDYERLTEDQENETRELLEYCGLPWEDACLDFHRTKRAVRTASSGQVRRKIYTGSSEAWRRYESHLEPLLAKLKATT
jgi:tetratricopeptide (TPR) repeat protein